MPTEEAMLTGALQGIAISIVFSFIVLVFATQNVILACISVFCVTIVITSITGIMNMRGQ